MNIFFWIFCIKSFNFLVFLALKVQEQLGYRKMLYNYHRLSSCFNILLLKPDINIYKNLKVIFNQKYIKIKKKQILSVKIVFLA